MGDPAATTLSAWSSFCRSGPPRADFGAARGRAMPMTAEQLREHLAQAEQHIAELKRRISKQRQLVGRLPLESLVRDEAIDTLVVLEDSLPILREAPRTTSELDRRTGEVTSPKVRSIIASVASLGQRGAIQ